MKTRKLNFLNIVFKIIPTLILFWIGQLKAEDLTPIYIFRQKIDLSPELCRETWTIRNKSSADCEFKIPNSSSGIELTKNSLFTDWTYDSTEGWFINFWAKSTPQGFSVTASSEQSIPADRIHFEVAQKYLKDLFAGAKNQMLRSVAKSNSNHNVNFETYLGELKLFKRTYNLNSTNFIQRCIERAKATQAGFSCIVPLLSTLKGELSADEIFFAHQGQFPKGTMGLTVFSEKAWGESAAFAPLVFSARWSGLKDPQLFKISLTESLSLFEDNRFEIGIYKPGSAVENNELFREQPSSDIRTVNEFVQFDQDLCAQNSRVSEQNFECSFSLSGDEYFLLENELALFTDISGDYQIKIERKQNRLIFSVYSENKKVESPQAAIQLLKSALSSHNKTRIELKRIIKVPQ